MKEFQAVKAHASVKTRYGCTLQTALTTKLTHFLLSVKFFSIFLFFYSTDTRRSSTTTLPRDHAAWMYFMPSVAFC
jgi:hypothetical protein